jgi:LPPG:FO 2-phospho-L-lactate transferase
VLEAIAAADLLVICPSNPWVSVDPILAVHGVRQAVTARRNDLPVVAVSPIIAGRTIKGPAAKMFAELGIQPTPAAVARHYQGLISGIVMDRQDEPLIAEIRDLRIGVFVTDTIMRNDDQRLRLAQETLDFILQESH